MKAPRKQLTHPMIPSNNPPLILIILSLRRIYFPDSGNSKIKFSLHGTFAKNKYRHESISMVWIKCFVTLTDKDKFKVLTAIKLRFKRVGKCIVLVVKGLMFKN